jgi:C-terminal processing protease CtpA/Prc
VLLALGCSGGLDGVFGGASGGANGGGSVGAVFGRDADSRALYVREVPSGLGAEEAGLLAGDQVVMIEGLYVRDLSEKEIRAKMRGEVGSVVTLTVLRGNDVHHVRVTRSARRAHEAAPAREQKIAE